MIEGFLFCLGVVLCLWCLMNLDLVFWVILFAVVVFASIAVVVAIVAAAILLWQNYGLQMTYSELNQAVGGILLFLGMCWLGGLWMNRGKS